MINTSKKGTRYELEIVKELKAKGYISVRSSASKSPIDIWAINPDKRELLLIQAKSGKRNKKEKTRILERYSALNGTFSVRFEVWQK